MFSKKALGPVVAVALLLVVGVTAVIGFQTWYQSYSSQLFTQSESQGSDLTTGVERVVGETLYFKSNKDNTTITRVQVGNQDCNYQNSTQKGITQIDISSCLSSAPTGTAQEAVIYTNQGVYSEEFIANSPSAACYNPENIGTVGTSGVCQGMLIVNKTMLQAAGGTSTLGWVPDGDQSFSITGPDGIEYTFEDSTYNVFTGQVTSMRDLFSETSFNGDINYWDVSNVISMHRMFVDATSFNQPLDNWDVSNVVSMNSMFPGATSFNQDISNWDMSNVEDISYMFAGATSFNQPLDNWDVSSVERMSSVFAGASSFNQPLNSWDISMATSGWGLRYMFKNATSFNQPLDNWDVGDIRNMDEMFVDAISFNQNLSSWCVAFIETKPTSFDLNSGFESQTQLQPNWNGSCSFVGTYTSSLNLVNNSGTLTCESATPGQYGTFNGDSYFVVDNNNLKYFANQKGLIQENESILINSSNICTSHVTNMDSLFEYSNFNTNINHWDTSNVENMFYMFRGTTDFNQPLDNWDVSNVKDMYGMFAGASSFNQDISSWNMRNVEDIGSMFSNADSFNQPLDNWNVSNVMSMWGMFNGADSFNQPLDNWDTSNVESMGWMFRSTNSFNGSINSWNVTSVVDVEDMFKYTDSFNQPLNNWTLSNVTYLGGMFRGATSFNQPLDNWNVSLVTDVYEMFQDATSYNQDLSSWDVDQIGTNCYNFDNGATSWSLPKPNLDPSCLS